MEGSSMLGGAGGSVVSSLPSHTESFERAAGFGQEWEALPDLSFCAYLCSSSKNCFPNLHVFSNLALWVKTHRPQAEQEGNVCACRPSEDQRSDQVRAEASPDVGEREQCFDTRFRNPSSIQLSLGKKVPTDD